jgi:hypothetical protein
MLVGHTVIDSGLPRAVLTTAVPADWAAFLPPPTAATKRRGNPNRDLAPRTIHGNHGAEPRALNRFRCTLLRIRRVDVALNRHQAHRRPTLAARRSGYPPVLMPPLRPRGGITAAEDRAMRDAVAASLARRRAALAEAGARHRVARAATAAQSTQRAARAPAADGQTRAAHTNASPRPPAPPPVPIAPYSGDSHPERELAAHTAGLRAAASRPPQRALTPDATAPFKPSRVDPLNREPTAKPATAPFKPFRLDPMNREPGAFPDPATNQYIATMNPLISANPRDAPHTRSRHYRQEIFATDERG